MNITRKDFLKLGLMGGECPRFQRDFQPRILAARDQRVEHPESNWILHYAVSRFADMQRTHDLVEHLDRPPRKVLDRLEAYYRKATD